MAALRPSPGAVPNPRLQAHSRRPPTHDPRRCSPIPNPGAWTPDLVLQPPSPGATPDPGRRLLSSGGGSRVGWWSTSPESRRGAEAGGAGWPGGCKGEAGGGGNGKRGGAGPQAAPGGSSQAQGRGGAGRGRAGPPPAPPQPPPRPARALTCSGSASRSAGGTRSTPPLSKPTAFSVKTMQRACAARARPRPSGSPPSRSPPAPPAGAATPPPRPHPAPRAVPEAQ